MLLTLVYTVMSGGLSVSKLTTVRPQDTRPQAAGTFTMHIFEQGQNNFRCTNLCSENLKLHDF